MVFYFQKGHYLVDEFSKKIEMLIEAGLTEWWLENHLESKRFSGESLKTEPTKLTIQQLFGVFEACAYCLIFAGIVLAFELLFTLLHKNHKIKKIFSIKTITR